MSLIFLIIIIMVLMLIVKKLKVNSPSYRISKHLVMAYFLILVLSAVTVNFLPDGKFLTLKKSNIAREQVRYWDLGHLEEILSAYNFQGEQTLRFTENTLKIRSKAADMKIFVEKEKDLKNEIKVASYVGEYDYLSYDFSPVLLPPKVTLYNDTLWIDIEPQEVNLKMFDAGFSVKQFKGGEEGRYYSLGSWGRIIHIQIPDYIDVAVDSDSPNVYLND